MRFFSLFVLAVSFLHFTNGSIQVTVFQTSEPEPAVEDNASDADSHKLVPLAGVRVPGDFGPYACTGSENNSKGGKGPRPFKVTCRNKSAKQSLTCNFNGNPHSCSDYNNKGQTKFYSQLLNGIGTFIQNNNACGPASLTTKLCGDQAVYKLQ